MERQEPIHNDYAKLFPKAKFMGYEGEYGKIYLTKDLYIVYNEVVVVLYDKTQPLFPVSVKPSHKSMMVYLEELNMCHFSIN